MKNQILLINDLAGYGNISLNTMMTTLSQMHMNLYNLPTALVSNTLDYGKFEILETTSYMKNTIEVWKELGFVFDAISTGFIVTHEQTKIIKDFCIENKGKSIIFCDPIMGDEGKLYNGVDNQTVHNMQELIGVADYIVPNYTEAAFLADVPIQDTITCLQAHEIIDHLRQKGAGSVIMTSVPLEDTHAVVGYDANTSSYFQLPYEEIPVRFAGTGDLFSAVVLGKLLQGVNLVDSVSKAMDVVYCLILANQDLSDRCKGLPLADIGAYL